MSFRIEVFQLKIANISWQSVELLDKPDLRTIRVGIKNGARLIYGIDYSINNNSITWANLGLSTKGIHVGDILYAAYETHPNSVYFLHKLDKFTLTSTNISDKNIIMNIDTESKDTILAYFRRGPTLLPTYDFEISGESSPYTLSWDGFDLENILESGDIIDIEYVSTTSNKIRKRRIIQQISTGLLQSKNIQVSDIHPEYSYTLGVGRAGYLSEGFDYELIGDILSWDNTVLDNTNMLRIGDWIEVMYHASEKVFDAIKLWKVNELFDAPRFLKDINGSDEWGDSSDLFWKFMYSVLGNPVTQTIYEHSINLVQNVVDIETCSVDGVYSLAKMLDQSEILSNRITMPNEVRRLVDIFSCNPSYVVKLKKILRDDVVADIWNSAIVQVFALNPDEYYEEGFPEIEFIPMENYLIFVETILRNLLDERTKFEYFNIDQEKINHPENFEWDTEAKQELYNYHKAKDFLGFMMNLSPSLITWNESNKSTIINTTVRVLVNYCLRISYMRESLKNLSQKYAMVGSAKGISKILEEHIKQLFSNPTDWFYQHHPLENAGQYDNAIEYVKSISSDILASIYFPHLEQLKNLNVSITEYFDKTEYLNIESGNITAGNPRYWEGTNLDLAKIDTQVTNADAREYYTKTGLTIDKVKFVESGMGFDSDLLNAQEDIAHNIMDTYAESTYARDAVIPDMQQQVLRQYKYFQPDDVPARSKTNKPIDLSPLQQTYMGTPDKPNPIVNIKNQDFPTIAQTPFIWNIIEKAFRIDLPLTTSIVGKLEERFDLVDEDGTIKNYWKIYARELIGYITKYENSNNIDIKNFENSNIDRDGPFGSPLALETYILSGSIPFTFYEHILEKIPYEEIRRQELFKNDIGTLSGRCVFDNDIAYNKSTFNNLTNELSPFNFVLSGNVLTNYETDIFGNHMMLYKNSYEKNIPGIVWIRLNNYPLPYPIAYGFLSITTIEDAVQWIVDNGFISNSEELNIDELDGIHSIKLKNSSKLIAKWFNDNLSNRYQNTLQIVDRDIQPINFGNIDFAGIQYALNNCYDIRCIGDDIIVIGKAPNGKVGIYVVKIERKVEEVDDVIYQWFDISLKPNDYPFYIEVDNIEKFAGFYEDGNNLVFVDAKSIVEGSATFEFRTFDRNARIEI